MATSRSASGRGSDRNKTPWTSVKIAVLADADPQRDRQGRDDGAKVQFLINARRRTNVAPQIFEEGNSRAASRHSSFRCSIPPNSRSVVVRASSDAMPCSDKRRIFASM